VQKIANGLDDRRGTTMERFIDMEKFAETMQFALAAYVVSAFILSPIATMLAWRFSRGRRGTFLLVTLGLFLVFTLIFYGLPFLMIEVWQVAMPTELVYGISLAVALGVMLLIALLLRIALVDGPSALEVEFDTLSEAQMSPIDLNRKANMERRRGGSPKRR
jgi:MFS family permease